MTSSLLSTDPLTIMLADHVGKMTSENSQPAYMQ